MMIEKGRVMHVQDRLAVVRVVREDSCGSCGAHCNCDTDGRGRQIEVTAQNPVEANVGDFVKLSLSAGKMLGLSAVTYILPLLFLFAGAIAGASLSRAVGLNLDTDMSAALWGFIFLLASFTVLTIVLRKQKPGGRISPVIVEILIAEGCTNCASDNDNEDDPEIISAEILKG